MLEAVHRLSAGFCLHPEFMSIRGGGWRPCRFPAGFLYLRHARFGHVLFDTGYSDHFRKETASFPNLLYAKLMPPRFQAADRACDQIERMGVRASEVGTVVLSHFHADHIAGLRDFPNARIVASRSGYAAMRRARGIGGLLQGLLPGLMPQNADDRIRFTDALAAVPLPPALAGFGPARDLFGDGSALLVELPGHSTGQIGLYLPETTQGALFLVADAAWSQEAIAGLRPPPRLVTAMLGETGTYRRTLETLHRLQHAMPHLAIRPAHCRHEVCA
jgi:glyoxylase-like metal-dependent hydrolase (beta-lactamase superfamily II)